MYFEYAQYVRGCLVTPIFASLFTLSVLIPLISHFVAVIIQEKSFSRDMIKFLLVVLVCGFFLSMNVGRLLHGGIYLIYESESDAVELQGEILENKELGPYSFPKLNTEYGHSVTANGVQLVIDGIECTAVTRGTLEVGDKVTVTFLPKSGYVLSITPNDVE